MELTTKVAHCWDVRDTRAARSRIPFRHDPGSRGQTQCGQTCLTAPVPAHRHDSHLIAFVLAGSGQHEDDGGRLPLFAGDVCVMLPGQWHAYPRVRGTLTLVNVAIDRVHLAACTPLLGEIPWLGLPPAGAVGASAAEQPPTHLRLSPFELGQFRPLLQALSHELDDPFTRTRPGVGAGLLMQIIGLLDRTGRRSTPQSVVEDRQHETGLLGAIRYLEERYMGPIAVQELAVQSGYTSTYLTRKFRQRLGMTPSEYLLQLRIQQACALLRDTALSVTAIGNQVGFRDGQYFATRFHRVMDMTPSDFRARSRIDSHTAWRKKLEQAGREYTSG